MNQYYQPFYKQAVDLQYRFHDVLDQPHHPMANIMRTEIQHLVDDFETGKHPRSIENRIHTIQNQLVQIRAQGDQVMDYNHNDSLHRSYEDMRLNLRKLPNY